jgi:site-specific DNA-methyltransferase (adenine-specific)
VANDRRRKATSTSVFGVGKRENHDATAFYARFTPPEFSNREDVDPHKSIDDIFLGDSSSMTEIADDSVALVVTSPPYFAGKAYETALGEGHVPANYIEYLEMLHRVFSECVRTLEPGGRIAVNVANLGRRPYRSLSADVIKMLEDMGLLLRGEVIWVKARGAGGSCAWGSFQRPGNPVLRDLTERIIIASKERFDRAVPAAKRAPDLPHEWSLFKDEFMEATTDVWEMSPESATRVGHPAPFPVELPERLIHLYTYVGDLVLDPFMGSGTTAVAAVRTGRHFAGYDTEPEYRDRALRRIAEERAALEAAEARRTRPTMVRLTSKPAVAPDDEDFQARAVREGRAARDLALEVLEECDFDKIESNIGFSEGIEVNFRAKDAEGATWLFDVSGGFTSSRPGLKRTDTLWKALGKASVLHEAHKNERKPLRLVLLTTDRPTRNSAGDKALRVVLGVDRPIRDVIQIDDPDDLERLRGYAAARREADR